LIDLHVADFGGRMPSRRRVQHCPSHRTGRHNTEATGESAGQCRNGPSAFPPHRSSRGAHRHARSRAASCLGCRSTASNSSTGGLMPRPSSVLPAWWPRRVWRRTSPLPHCETITNPFSTDVYPLSRPRHSPTSFFDSPATRPERPVPTMRRHHGWDRRAASSPSSRAAASLAARVSAVARKNSALSRSARSRSRSKSARWPATEASTAPPPTPRPAPLSVAVTGCASPYAQ
jgi:hypothetical protein